jgi:hypothetical protein
MIAKRVCANPKSAKIAAIVPKVPLVLMANAHLVQMINNADTAASVYRVYVTSAIVEAPPINVLMG